MPCFTLRFARRRLAQSVDHDMIGPLFHDRSLAVEPIGIENGYAVSFPDGVGLGVEADFEPELRELEEC